MNEQVESNARGPSVRTSCGVPIAVFALLLAGSCAFHRWSEPRGHLPSAIEIAEVEEWNSEGFFMEVCEYGRFKLRKSSVDKLRRDGLNFVQQAGRPAKNPERSGEWKRTPLIARRDQGFDARGAGAEHIFALSATSCGGRGRDGIHQARLNAGSFYALTSNREGLVLIDPQQGKAWFLYFG